VDDRLALGPAQPHGTGLLGRPAEAEVLAVLGLPGVDLRARRGGPVGGAGVEQLLDDLAVALLARGLHERALVPVQAEPPQRVEDLLDGLGRRALPVGVLDAQQVAAAVVAGLQPVEERRPGAADVEVAGGRGSEADAHGRRL
jgi:hypothetical protein